MLQSVESLLENSRSQFPRLYFVSDEALVEALASPLNDCHLLLLTRQCFPGILDIVVEPPNPHPQTIATRWSSAVNCMICFCYYGICVYVCGGYGDGMGNTAEENFSIFSLI